MAQRSASRSWVIALVVIVVIAQVALAGLLERRPSTALLVAAAFLGLVLVLVTPRLVLLAALPATYLSYRVGASSTDISLADLTLGVALVAAVPLVPWRSPTLRQAFVVLGAYLLILALPMLANLSGTAAVEWAHRAFLVGASILVGSAIAAVGYVRKALRLFVLASAVVAVAAIIDALGHWESGQDLPPPAYPFDIHKNAAGFLMACALLLIVIAPRQLSLRRTLRIPLLTLLFLGVAACQARGGAITVVIVLLVWVVRERRLRLSPLVVLGAALLIAMTYVTVSAAFESDADDRRFGSVDSRFATYEAAVDLWEANPIVGVGVKYWRDPSLFGQTAFGEPHNLAVSALAETGVVGLFGLLVLASGMLALFGRRRDERGRVAFSMVLAKIVDSTVGIYWVAGTMTFSWIMVGLACDPEPREADEMRPVRGVGARR